jgi:hypothetical protein
MIQIHPTNSQRDDNWLECHLRALQNKYFRDVDSGYPICVRFGRRAKRRFGSISARQGICYITINGWFRHSEIPEYVVDATLAHELAHYVHGFGSGLQRQHAEPHRGGVVEEELRQRGCFHLEQQAKIWRDTQWPDFYATHIKNMSYSRVATSERNRQTWEAYLKQPGFRTEKDLKQLLCSLVNRFGLSTPPFQVTWLSASQRQTGLSYRNAGEEMVQLHGLLAHPKVPESVLVFELACWLAMSRAGKRWTKIEQVLKEVGLWELSRQALHWRRYHWTRHRKTHHPLIRRK